MTEMPKRERNDTRGQKRMARDVADERATKRAKQGRFDKAMVEPRDGSFNRELKYLDTALSFLCDATAEVPATGLVNLIPQGDTQSTRDGYKCTVTSIRMTGVLEHTPPATTDTGTAVAKIYLVLDTQCNGAAPAVTDVLTGTDIRTSLPSIENSERFKILKEWKYSFNAAAGAPAQYSSTTQWLKYYRKCNIPLSFTGTDGSITTIRTNNIFLIAGGNAAADDEVAFLGTCRLRFSDN